MFTVEELCKSTPDFKLYLTYTHPEVPENPFEKWANSVSLNGEKDSHEDVGLTQPYFNFGDTCIYHSWVDKDGTEKIMMGYSKVHSYLDQYNRTTGKRIALLRMLDFPVILTKDVFVDYYFNICAKNYYMNNNPIPLVNKAQLKKIATFPRMNAFAIACVCAYAIDLGSDEGKDSEENWKFYFRVSDEAIRRKYCEMKDAQWSDNISQL